jgi:5-methylcytosine-specific restriction enzyme A
MKNPIIGKVIELADHKLGIKVHGAVNPTSRRQGVSFWFDGYSRGSGPLFTIRPTGLKRHQVNIIFGSYSAPCIKHIESHASDEEYKLAHAFTEQLKKDFEVKINNNEIDAAWKISHEMDISVTRKISALSDNDEILSSVEAMMLPMMAAIAELIGYEEIEEYEEGGEEEGAVYETQVKRRERSQRNRLLCLSIHGEQCGVCGFEPSSKYNPEVGSILEVHHIEQLANTLLPKIYNPSTDLLPLCPNCHRAIHTRRPAFTPEELRKKLKL